MNRNALNQIGVITPTINYNKDFDLPESVKSESDHVFDMIFAPDPVSGLPRNDIGVFLNDKTSPTVRDFIQSQLHQDLSGKRVAVPDGISDDDIASLTRDSKETIEEYSSRVNAYMKNQAQVVKRFVRDRKLAAEKQKLEKSK